MITERQGKERFRCKTYGNSGKATGSASRDWRNISCVSQQSVAQYENDVHEPDIETLKRLSTFFGVSVDYIIGNTDVPYLADDAAKYLLNGDEKDFMALYRSLPETGRAGLLALLRSLLSSQ